VFICVHPWPYCLFRHPPLVYTFSFPYYNAETYFPTEQSSPRQGARFSETHEDGRWPRRSLSPPRSGPQEADCQLGEVVRITNDSTPDSPSSDESTSGFPKSVRLLRSSDFRKVYDHGTRYTCPLFAAFCLADPAGGRAVGFTTPKALGKAVRRNRIRRRTREAARLELASLSAGWSIVFNPRRKVLDCIFTDLQREVKRLFIRCAASPVPSSPPRSGGTSA
jgi:ribonuclease P protein component